MLPNVDTDSPGKSHEIRSCISKMGFSEFWYVIYTTDELCRSGCFNPLPDAIKLSEMTDAINYYCNHPFSAEIFAELAVSRNSFSRYHLLCKKTVLCKVKCES